MNRCGAHIAFFTGAAYGHINPALGVVRELVNRGHRVSYATTAAFAALVASAGAVPHVYQSALPTDPRRWPADLARIPLLFLADAREVAPAIEAGYGGDRPDLVVSEDPAGAGMVLAAKWGIPAVQLWPFLPTAEHWSARVARLGTPPEQQNARRYLSAVAAFLAEHGVDRDPARQLSYAASCHVVLIPRQLHADPDTLDERFVFAGPCLADAGQHTVPPQSGSWRPPESGRPVLLVTLGSLNTDHPEFYRACLDAFADGPWHVVMSIGHRLDRAAIGVPPPHVELHPQVPQLAVLEHASLSVNHAGMGTVLESLYHGVPLVTVPFLPEQVDNARRVIELGLGRSLAPEAVTADRLRDTVHSVAADPAVAARVAEFQRELRAVNAACVAADAIEAQLS
jgi:MGT family glycosyltransferase